MSSLPGRGGRPGLEAGRWGEGLAFTVHCRSLWSRMFCTARTRAGGRAPCFVLALANPEPPRRLQTRLSWISKRVKKKKQKMIYGPPLQ